MYSSQNAPRSSKLPRQNSLQSRFHIGTTPHQIRHICTTHLAYPLKNWHLVLLLKRPKIVKVTPPEQSSVAIPHRSLPLCLSVTLTLTHTLSLTRSLCVCVSLSLSSRSRVALSHNSFFLSQNSLQSRYHTGPAHRLCCTRVDRSVPNTQNFNLRIGISCCSRNAQRCLKSPRQNIIQ